MNSPLKDAQAKQMKSLSKLHREPGIWMTDNPVPEIGPNDLMIKILSVLIS